MVMDAEGPKRTDSHGDCYLYVCVPHDATHNVFFLSTRRRHTRSLCDWSSDVCSSDLTPVYYGRYLGFDKPPHLWGGWAEYVYVDLDMLPGTKVYKLPDDMSLRLGALSEPLTSCIRAFNRAIEAGRFTWGNSVVIQGSGPIGILAVAAAQEMGAGRVICVGAPEAPRLALARRMGAEVTVNIDDVKSPEARIDRVPEIVSGFGADRVIDCCGHPSSGP